MALARKGFWVVGMALAMFFAVGCCDKENQQISALTGELADAKVLSDQLKSELNKETQRANDLQGKLAAANRGASETATPTPADSTGKTADGWEKGLVADRVTVGTDILFAAGKASLTPQGKAALSKIAQKLRSDYAGMPVRVMGYTDKDPIVKSRKLWQDNLDLSCNRSMAVVRYLWSKGVAKDLIETVGLGDTRFIAANTTRAGKAQNRRVEIVVIKAK